MKNTNRPLTPAMRDTLDELRRHSFHGSGKTLRALMARGLVRLANGAENYPLILTPEGYEALGDGDTAQMLRAASA